MAPGTDSISDTVSDTGGSSDTGENSDTGTGPDTSSDSNQDPDIGTWQPEIIGTYARFYEIKIGDGRNDGVNRLYAACHNGDLVEWTFVSEGSPFEMRYMGGVTDDVSDVSKRMISIWLGQGRNDGVNRIYAANVNGNVYELSYDNAFDSWEMEIVGVGNFQTGIVVGDSRNDGVTRVVATGSSVPVNEYSWNGDTWNVVDVSDGLRDIWPPSIGQGRNDGTNRLYGPDWSAPYLREYSWNGLAFEEAAISTSGKLVKTVTGDGRNDGIERVYASEMKGHIIEFSSDGMGGWKQVDIMDGQEENLSRYGLYLGKTHDDDVNRLYSVAQGGKLTEHAFVNDAWTSRDIDAVTGATADLTVGKGRRDNINRVYVAGANGVLYEYTHSDFAK